MNHTNLMLLLWNIYFTIPIFALMILNSLNRFEQILFQKFNYFLLLYVLERISSMENKPDNTKDEEEWSSYTSDEDDLKVPPAKSAKVEENKKKLSKILSIGVSSTFWNYFGFPSNKYNQIFTHNKVLCKLCRDPLKMGLDIVCKMREHLEKCSPAVFAEAAAAEDELPLRELCNIPCIEIHEDEDKTSSSSDEDHEESGKNEELPQVTKNLENCTEEEKSEELCNNVLNFITHTLRPKSIPDLLQLLVGIGSLRSLTLPLTLPTESGILGRIPQKKQEVKAKLVKKLETLAECSLSVDVWSRGHASEDNVTVSINYLEGPVLKNTILFTQPFYDYPAKYLREEFVDRMQEEWGIKKESVLAVVGSLEVKWNELWEDKLQVPIIPCFVDFFDKLVQDELFRLPKVGSLIGKCYLEKGFSNTYVHTYWEDYFFKLKGRLECPENYELDKTEVYLLKQLLAVMDSLKLALDTFKQENPYGQVSVIWPILNMLLTVHFAPNEDQDNPVLRKMKNVAVAFTNTTFSKAMPFLQFASKLDPRFR